MKRFISAALVGAAFTGATAVAAPVVPQSYDMRNGQGQTVGGTFNYWDSSYNGSGNTSVDGAALSGGLGDLTDGYIETQDLGAVENVAGTGPYVGWLTFDPVIDFNFATSTAFNSMTIYFTDRDGAGGVDHISNVNVAGFGSFNFGDPAGTTQTSLTIDLTGLVSDTVSITLSGAAPWIFVSEIQFDAASEVPLPGALPLMAAGLGLMGWRKRKSQKAQ